MTDENSAMNDDPMGRALSLARAAADAGEVPVGAVITDMSGQIIAATHNQMTGHNNATAHAELLAIEQAMRNTGRARLDGCDLWVTLEPCAMCAGAIAHARIARLYYGADDPKGGAVDNGPCLFNQPTIHHRPEIYGGIRAREAAALLTEFFANKR